MNTTGLVTTVTDELLAELEAGINSMTMRTAYVSLIVAEIGRMRAENAGLAQSLAESRANDQAAMGWLTSLRWASGDRGERMLPELVEHIEWLVKNAWRYRFVRRLDNDCFMLNTLQRVSGNDLDTAIDTAMQADK